MTTPDIDIKSIARQALCILVNDIGAREIEDLNHRQTVLWMMCMYVLGDGFKQYVRDFIEAQELRDGTL